MKPYFVLLRKDIRILLRSSTFYLMMIVSSLVAGNSFILAVDLYSKASIAALNDPFYAKSFEPVPGIFVPTMGGFYLVFSLIFPFVVIPLLSKELENNTLLVLYQLEYSAAEIVWSKVVASLVAILSPVSLVIPSLIFWKVMGGHIPLSEIALLLAGYILYGLVVTSVSIFSASILKNTSAAAILALGTTLFSWILDFSGTVMSSHIVHTLERFSLSRFLPLFEKGILSFKAPFDMILLSSFLISVSSMLIYPGVKKQKNIAKIAIFATIVLLLWRFDPVEKDITESHRNSFPVQLVNKLRKIDEMKIEIYLSPEDSRYRDYESEFLSRLKLIRRDVKVLLKDDPELKYGLIRYEIKVNGKWKADSTYSTSPEEAFSILSALSGVKLDFQENPYPGYPLVIDSRDLDKLKILYFLILPAAFTLLLFMVRK